MRAFKLPVSAVVVHMAVVTGFVGRLAPSPPVTPRRAIAIWALRSDAQPGKHPIYHIHECPPHERTREIAARSARFLFCWTRAAAPVDPRGTSQHCVRMHLSSVWTSPSCA